MTEKCLHLRKVKGSTMVIRTVRALDKRDTHRVEEAKCAQCGVVYTYEVYPYALMDLFSIPMNRKEK
jgi:hypothetical protein